MKRLRFLDKRNFFLSHVPEILGIGVITTQFVYYTFIIGGDHFEYRVYSHLVLLIFVTIIWVINRLSCNSKLTLVYLTSFILCSYPIPWTHYWASSKLKTRAQTHSMKVPIAQYFPTPLREYVSIFDGMQKTLISHAVCRRHQEHKVFFEYQTSRFPSRTIGGKIPFDDFPVAVFSCVGMPGWILPNIAIIDNFGLNDYVIARNPITIKQMRYRKMAHDRRSPKGYTDCFKPNIFIENGKIKILNLKRKLSVDDIKKCECKKWN